MALKSAEQEILPDKIVALCLRKFIKARDLWDIIWLEQKNITVNDDWVISKFSDYQSSFAPNEALRQKLTLLPSYWQSGNFENEMRRFLPRDKITETFEKPEFMAYFTAAITGLLEQSLNRWETGANSKSVFRL